MKIIFNHLLNDHSGSPKVLSQVIKAVDKFGYKSVVITSRNTRGFLSDFVTPDISFNYYHSENKIQTLIKYFWVQFHTYFQLRKFKNDKHVIIYINTLLPIGAAIFGWYYSKTVIYHVHEVSIKPTIFKSFLVRIMKLTATKIIYVSKFLQREFHDKSKSEIVIYNSVPDEIFHQGIKSANTWIKSGGKFEILMISSLKTYKGVNEFVKLAKAFEEDTDYTFTLVLNTNHSGISEYFDLEVLPNNLRIYPSQDDVNKYYLRASLLLNLSRPREWVETFGLTIVEALCYGIPVIVPPIGGPIEIVNDGVEGYTISSENLHKISDRIKYLKNNLIVYQKMSTNCRNRARDFRESVFIDTILNFINE